MNCPCCSGKLLQHIGSKGLYWYCPDCRQPMPILLAINPSRLQVNCSLSPNRQFWIYIPLQPEQFAS
ncbi:hypothetical protein BST81_18605 [Leptolyngbya sp. 'hensonii']|nr:hypothetical protein BST81_18605 [Leptolyngbya sp. 'hensonii']